MNFIDLIIVVLLLLGAFRGFTDGFIKELASLAALILGIWGAIRFSSLTAGKLYEYFDMTGRYTGIIAFIVTLVLIIILVHFVGVIVDRFVGSIELGFLNRLAGIAFGLFKTALILSVFFVILNAIDARRPFLPKEKLQQSKFYGPVSDFAPALFPVIGEGDFYKSFDRFKKKPEGIPI